MVVIGLGNELLGDDGLGPVVARELAALGTLPHVEVREAAAGGLRLLELLEGFSRAILVDAVETSEQPPGTIRELSLEAALLAVPAAGGHGIRLDEALALGRALGVTLPSDVVCLSVAVADARTFREGLTPAVAEAVPVVLGRIESQLARWLAGEAVSTRPGSPSS